MVQGNEFYQGLVGLAVGLLISGTQNSDILIEGNVIHGMTTEAIDINYKDGRPDQSIEFREVWWADLDEPASVWNARTPSRRAGGDLAEGALYVSGSVGRRLPDAGAV